MRPNEVHIIPINDRIEHEPSENCICGPTCEPSKRNDGSFSWIYIHPKISPEVKTEANS